MPAAHPQPDRRVAPRFQPAHWTLYRLKPCPGEPGTVGLVWNISRTGVSLFLATSPEPGASFEGELVADGWGLPVALRVVHIGMAQTGDYVVGARFTRQLDQDELDLFLAP